MRKVFAVICAALVVLAVRVQSQEKTAGVDDEGFIRDWLVLASVDLGDKASTHEEDSQKPMFDKEYYPEQNKVNPKAGDKAKIGDRELEWKAVTSDNSIMNILKLCEDTSSPKVNCLAMGVCYIMADEDIANVKLKIGSDDSSLWKLNDTEVIRVYSGRATDKDQDTKEGLTLKKGVNVLKFAVINGEGEFSICARFVDKDDKPVKNLKISLTPPPAPAAEAK